MSDISALVGENIRRIRKSKKISIQSVADTIHKSKSTVAKYETGDLGIDVDTLYQFSEALNVPVDQLLVPQIWVSDNTAADIHLPEYYKGRKLYAYFWDGRNSTLNTSVLTIGQQSEEIPYQYQAMLYMNVTDIDNPYLCEKHLYRNHRISSCACKPLRAPPGHPRGAADGRYSRKLQQPGREVGTGRQHLLPPLCSRCLQDAVQPDAPLVYGRRRQEIDVFEGRTQKAPAEQHPVRNAGLTCRP